MWPAIAACAQLLLLIMGQIFAWRKESTEAGKAFQFNLDMLERAAQASILVMRQNAAKDTLAAGDAFDQADAALKAEQDRKKAGG